MISALQNKNDIPRIGHAEEAQNLNSNSALMRDILEKIRIISNLDNHVILIGEMGVGKNRLAKIIHQQSKRSEGPFQSFYCLDIDETEFKEAFWEHIYFENEHLHLKYDLLEKACRGTLFLDQFSELNDELTSNFVSSYLRGCKQLFRNNEDLCPRLIISVNQESFNKMKSGETWRELLQLLNPITIMIPPLRERKEDIRYLIDGFLNEARHRDPMNNNLSIDSQAIDACENYYWPGNVRQLRNAIIQGSVLSKGEKIMLHHLPFSMNWKLPYKLIKG